MQNGGKPWQIIRHGHLSVRMDGWRNPAHHRFMDEEYDWSPAIWILIREHGDQGVGLSLLAVAAEIARIATPEPDTLQIAVASLRRALEAARMEDAL